MNLYVVGDPVKVSVAFTDSLNNAVDPGTVTLKYSVNGGVLTTWTYGGAGSIIKDSVGNYHAVLDTTGQSGTWTYEWQGTGGAVTGTPTAFSSFLATPAPL